MSKACQKNITFNMIFAALFAFFVMALLPDAAMAGVGGAAFDPVWTMLTDWSQGALGRIIAGTLILVGIVAGIARQSLMAFAVGIGAGIGLYNAPTVIDSIFVATLPVL